MLGETNFIIKISLVRFHYNMERADAERHASLSAKNAPDG